MFEKCKTWLNKLYQDLTSVNEDPHKVALSFGIGVFLGILPFTGVLAAIALAYLLKLNKPAAILGAAITNTWLGLIVLGSAINLGAVILKMSGSGLEGQMNAFMSDFHLSDIFSLTFLKFLLPVSLGYVLISCFFALLAYLLALGIIFWHRGSGR